MNRITSIFSFIDSNDKVVDVGCDQAKLGIMLAENGIKSIACDIKEIVIENAKKKINELNLNNYIDLRVSDGLEKINKDETDTLVLAGMGTYTMLNILSNSDILFKKIITISNNNHEILRTKMSDLGYKIFKEQIIKENNKYYNLIVFIKGKSDYTK